MLEFPLPSILVTYNITMPSVLVNRILHSLLGKTKKGALTKLA